MTPKRPSVRRRAELALYLGVFTAIGVLTVPSLRSQAAELLIVAQKNRAFAVRSISVSRGSTVSFSNEDDYAHQLRIIGPGLDLDSELQPPGEPLEVLFAQVGSFEVRCGIHPRMRMTVTAQ